MRHVACVGEKKFAYKVLVGKSGCSKSLLLLGMARCVICKRVIRNKMAQCGVDSPGSGRGQVVGCSVHCSDPSGSIKCEEFVD